MKSQVKLDKKKRNDSSKKFLVKVVGCMHTHRQNRQDRRASRQIRGVYRIITLLGSSDGNKVKCLQLSSLVSFFENEKRRWWWW